MTTLVLLPSPLLGPSVWQPVADALTDRGRSTMICAAGAPVRGAYGVFPDASTRVAVEREQPRLPLAHFESSLPVPPSWPQHRGAYLAFGEPYATDRGLATGRGWPVRTLPAAHLHLLIDPDAVATEIIGLSGRLDLSAH